MRSYASCMASRASNFCIDAADPYAQTMWWAQVLEDFTVDDEWAMEPDDEECGLAGPDDRYLLFLKVPEPKTVKNRMHICLRPTDRSRDEEVDRILGLGATLVDDLRNGDTRVGRAGRPGGQRVLRADAVPARRPRPSRSEPGATPVVARTDDGPVTNS